jgi:hypothetical protein
MPSLRPSFVAALIAAAAAGCGGGSIDINDLGPAVADSTCQYYVSCGLFSTVDDCKTFFGNNSIDPQLLADVEAGLIDYDGGAAKDCLDALASASCNQGDESSRTTPSSCDDAFSGTVADGGACFVSDECVSSNCVVPGCGMACCAGTCGPADPPPAAIGQSCEATFCVDGAYCDQTATCAALLPADSACQGDSQCAYGLLCLGAGTCQAPHDVGEDCITGGSAPECGLLGVVCDTTTNKCMRYLAENAACDPQVGGCQPFFFCDQTTMVCTSYPKVGQACPDGICAPGGFCDQTSQMCLGPQANGQTCSSDSQCQSNYCDLTSSVCADPVVCM